MFLSSLVEMGGGSGAQGHFLHGMEGSGLAAEAAVTDTFFALVHTLVEQTLRRGGTDSRTRDEDVYIEQILSFPLLCLPFRGEKEWRSVMDAGVLEALGPLLMQRKQPPPPPASSSAAKQHVSMQIVGQAPCDDAIRKFARQTPITRGRCGGDRANRQTGIRRCMTDWLFAHAPDTPVHLAHDHVLGFIMFRCMSTWQVAAGRNSTVRLGGRAWGRA